MQDQHNASPRTWIGTALLDQGVSLALTDATGAERDRAIVPNVRKEVMKVLRHWRARHGIEPAQAVFCLDERFPPTSAVMQVLARHAWRIRRIDMDLLTDRSGMAAGDGLLALQLVRYAISHPQGTLLPESSYQQEARIAYLRERRQGLLSLKGDLGAWRARHGAHMEIGIQREFDRMDRRHAQLIDKLLLRLDTLISLQMDDRGGA